MIPIYDDNPALGRPIVTIAIIAGCILVWFWQISLGLGEREAIMNLGLVPSAFLGNTFQNGPITPLFTVFTSMFMHGGFMHLGGNMLYLWIFGNKIEDVLGKFRFILFYFVCGTIAALGHIATDMNSQIPMVGASGAISGILGAYLILFPFARIKTFIFLGFFWTIARIPAIVLLLFWIGLQIWNSASTGTGGTAWFAHIGGFIAGVLLILPFKHIRLASEHGNQ